MVISNKRAALVCSWECAVRCLPRHRRGHHPLGFWYWQFPLAPLRNRCQLPGSIPPGILPYRIICRFSASKIFGGVGSENSILACEGGPT